jgi:hypothetical protein
MADTKPDSEGSLTGGGGGFRKVMEGVILESIVPVRSSRGAADVRTEFWGM